MQEAGKPLRAVMRALLFRRDCSVDRRSPSTNGAENLLEQLEGAIAFSDAKAGHVLVFVFAEIEKLVGKAIGDESPDGRLLGKTGVCIGKHLRDADVLRGFNVLLSMTKIHSDVSVRLRVSRLTATISNRPVMWRSSLSI